MPRRTQSGLTLVVALVMLVVLSLLVISAIRFGLVNLKIAGNVQSETEASAAAQLALESTMAAMAAAPNISTIPAKPEMVVSTGGRTFKVNVKKPSCILTKNVETALLDPSIEADRKCFGTQDPERQQTASGGLTTTATECKDQQWDVEATVDDDSGTKVAMLQGAAVRVSAEVTCH